jgi:hypothetical protein
MNEGYDKEIIFDTNTHTLMMGMPGMRKEVA